MKDSAQQELDAYLARWPDETDGLRALREQLADGPDDPFARSNLRGHITASAVVVTPDLGQVLLIHHRMLDKWIQPGGHVEPAPSLWHSAMREVEEETGVVGLVPHASQRVGGLLRPIDIDTHAIPPNDRKAEGAHWHHDYAYLAVAETAGALRAQWEEVGGAEWRAVASLGELPDARMRKLGRKLSALRAAGMA